jgi:hypothetical protein
MNLKALITTIILGSSSVASSVAMARPAAPAPAPVVRDHRAPLEQVAYRPQYRPSWIALGDINHVANGEMSLWVGRSAREFSTLKLQSTGGKSLIQQVRIQFANGRTQTVTLNQYLTASSPAITIDLNGRSRAIAKVTVVGRNARHSAFRVLAI